MKVRVVGRGVIKVVGARTPPESKSVGPTSIFFAALRAAGSGSVGRKESETRRTGIGRRSVRALETPLTSLPAAAAIGDQERRM